jgi:hypothetical protein
MGGSVSESVSPDPRWRSLVVILTMVASVAAAIVAGLQADAGIRSQVANRQSQVYALLASGEIFRQGIRSDFDLGTLAGLTKEIQDGLSLEITALEQEAEGNLESAALARQRAAVLQARVERAKQLSFFYTDADYAPSEADGLPDLTGYLDNLNVEANRLVALQNDQADAYQRWSKKGDAYVAVLALLAVTLFIFGLAQAAGERTRRTFTIFGAIVLGASTIWALTILIG